MYGMCKKIKNKLILKVFLNRDFYAGMVLFTCRFLYWNYFQSNFLMGQP